jgi:tetratricopeptide (TPR) repeat protein
MNSWQPTKFLGEGMKVFRKSLILAVALLTFNSYFAHAQSAPGRHPYYLHALQDLRHARACLDQLAENSRVDDMEKHAIGEIDAAIGELKKAAIDDGKGLGDHPPIDIRLSRTDRYHKALELLDKAHQDAAKEEDDPAVKGLQARSLHHIDEAHHSVDRALQTLLQ